MSGRSLPEGKKGGSNYLRPKTCFFSFGEKKMGPIVHFKRRGRATAWRWNSWLRLATRRERKEGGRQGKEGSGFHRCAEGGEGKGKENHRTLRKFFVPTARLRGKGKSMYSGEGKERGGEEKVRILFEQGWPVHVRFTDEKRTSATSRIVNVVFPKGEGRGGVEALPVRKLTRITIQFPCYDVTKGGEEREREKSLILLSI